MRVKKSREELKVMGDRLQKIENKLDNNIEEIKKDVENLSDENEIQKRTFIRTNATDLAELIKKKEIKKAEKKNIFTELLQFLMGK